MTPKRHEEPERRRGLDEARVVPAAVIRNVLGHVRRGAAVLAAQGQPLGETQGDEDDRGDDPDAGVGGQEADERRGQAHGDDGDEEGVLAADEIADPAEHDGAQRTHAEAGAEGGEAREERRALVPGREEELAEEHGQGAVEVEVVPLEERAQARGQDHAAQRSLIEGLGGSRRLSGGQNSRRLSRADSTPAVRLTSRGSGAYWPPSQSVHRSSGRYGHSPGVVPTTSRQFRTLRRGRGREPSESKFETLACRLVKAEVTR